MRRVIYNEEGLTNEDNREDIAYNQGYDVIDKYYKKAASVGKIVKIIENRWENIDVIVGCSCEMCTTEVKKLAKEISESINK